MIYYTNENYESVAAPEQAITQIRKTERTVKNRAGNEVEVDFYVIDFVDQRQISTRHEPTMRKTLPLPAGIELWEAFDDGDLVHWEISKASHATYSEGIFSLDLSLLQTVTDSVESSGERAKTLLVDRAGRRARINDIESYWTPDLFGLAEELLNRKLTPEDFPIDLLSVFADEKDVPISKTGT